MLKQVHLNDNVIYQYHKKYTVPIACFTKRLDLRKYVFSNRVIDHWNALSDVCVTSNTINQFRNCLKRELQPETHSYS